MNALFICNQNKHRSKTAELLFQERFNAKSAGLHGGKPITKKELEWADIVFVMEEEQRHELAKRFPSQYMCKRILNLDIPDIYTFNQPALAKLLQHKMKEYDEVLL
ncbi:MAG: phosphotyrosine protein phosphatase [Nanoarchaeota archaeon]